MQEYIAFDLIVSNYKAKKLEDIIKEAEVVLFKKEGFELPYILKNEADKEHFIETISDFGCPENYLYFDDEKELLEEICKDTTKFVKFIISGCIFEELELDIVELEKYYQDYQGVKEDLKEFKKFIEYYMEE